MSSLFSLRTVALAVFVAGTSLAIAAEPQVLLQGVHGTISAADLDADVGLRVPESERINLLSRPGNVEQMAAHLYIQRSWAENAAAEGMDKAPEVAAALRIAREKVLADAWVARIAKSNALSDEQALAMARTMYRAKPERFQVGEQVQVRHILVRGKEADKREQAEKLLEQLKAGADFSKLAEESSEDPSSAKRGGDLGFFKRGRMVPEFEEAAFALKNKGDLSAVVETQFGYHIIQLEGRKSPHIQPFDEVREPLIKEVRATVVSDARVKNAEEIKATGKPDNEAIAAYAAKYAEETSANAAAQPHKK